MCLKGRGSEEARKVGRSPIVKSAVCPLGSSLGPICSERWLAGGTKAGIVQRPTQEGQSGGHREGDVGGRKKHFAKSITSSSWLAACGRKGGVSPGISVRQQVALGEDHVYIKIKKPKPV